MTNIGLDLSINSTGVCVRDDNRTEYHIITDHVTKKNRDAILKTPFIHLHEYDKCRVGDVTEYDMKENCKSDNIYKILKTIETIVTDNHPDLVTIEGIAYGANGSVADLAGLQYAVRMMLREKDIPFRVITPMQLKKRATGNGNADKDEMVFAWRKCDPNANLVTYSKVDDIADAFFLAVS